MSGSRDGGSYRPGTRGEARDVLVSNRFDRLCNVLIASSLQGVAKTNGLRGMTPRKGFCLT